MKTLFYYFLALILTITSCTKVPNDGIPTYLKLNKPIVESDNINQGSNLHQMKDLWLQSDGVDLGAYEYPSIVPLFLKGEQELIINPGIYYNENVFERVIYPIYEPFKANYNFVQKDTIEITPIFKYRAAVDFIEISDFENSNNFENMLRTDIGDVNNIEGKAGIITLASNESTIKATTITPITITDNKRVYVEFSFKSESFIKVGIESTFDPTKNISLSVFKPVDDWYTAYFEITNFVNSVNEGAYNFFIDVQKNNSELEEKTYFDNFKIIQY